jgi:hypothetical protein
MTALKTVELVGFLVTLLFGVATLWQHRGDESDLARRRRRRVFGILLGVSLLLIDLFLKDVLSIGPWALLVAVITGGSVILIYRS